MAAVEGLRVAEGLIYREVRPNALYVCRKELTIGLDHDCRPNNACDGTRAPAMVVTVKPDHVVDRHGLNQYGQLKLGVQCSRDEVAGTEKIHFLSREVNECNQF